MKPRFPLIFLFGATVLQASPEVVQTLQGPAKADTIHRLLELNGRRRIKPWDLLKSSAGEYPSERLVFRDTLTGTVVWKMSRNPGYTLHTYSNLLTWNADGSKLLLSSTRPGGPINWLVTPDGGRWTPFNQDAAGWVYWSETDPNRLIFVNRRTEIFETDLASGQTRRLWDLSAEKGQLKLFRPSRDGRKFLVRQMYIPAGKTTHSFALVLNADGTGQPQRIDLGREAGQMWFLKRDDESFTFNSDGAEDTAQWVCEPAKNGAIHVVSRYRYYHVGISPSGRYAAFGSAQSSGMWISDLDTGAARLTVPYDRRIASIGGGHHSWDCDDQWLVASMGNAIYEVQAESGHTRLICIPNTQHSARAESEPQSSPDGTKLAYNSTMMGDGDVYVAVQRLPDGPRNVQRQGRVLTWDPPERRRELAGYGVYHGSQLLNREPVLPCRYEVPDGDGPYTVVAVERSGLQSASPDRAPPPAPSGLRGVARSPFVMELDWQPPASADVSGYNVYGSSQPQPAAIQENRIASPTEPHVIDWGLQAGAPYHYTVTAVDRSGQESAPCAELEVRTPEISRVVQRLPVAKSVGQAPLALDLTVPTGDRYLLWVELKAGHVVKSGQKLGVSLDGSRVVYTQPMWDYVATGHSQPVATPFFDTLKSDGSCNPWYALQAGAHHLNLTLPGGTAEIVSLTLTNDAGFLPAGITRFRDR